MVYPCFLVLLLSVFFLFRVITPIDIPKAMIEASIYSFEKQEIMTETLELALLMTLIFVLAKTMQETGAITKLIDSLRTFFSKGGTLGVIPAVYGLMPVPGGALFSAPLIDKEGDKYNLQKRSKEFFEHLVSAHLVSYLSDLLSDDTYLQHEILRSSHPDAHACKSPCIYWGSSYRIYFPETITRKTLLKLQVLSRRIIAD